MARVACRVTLAAAVLLCAAAGAKRVSIPDDLRDVVDEEEDDDWRHWGSRPGRGPGDRPPPDLSRMDPAAVQAELIRHHTGPSFGFVKLRPGVRRSREDVVGIATRWSNVLRTGSVEAKFVAVDFGTLMFTMERGKDILEVVTDMIHAGGENWDRGVTRLAQNRLRLSSYPTIFRSWDLKEFILSQAEAYEFKIGDQIFRRPGDPPLDQVIEKLQKEKRDKSKDEL